MAARHLSASGPGALRSTMDQTRSDGNAQIAAVPGYSIPLPVSDGLLLVERALRVDHRRTSINGRSARESSRHTRWSYCTNLPSYCTTLLQFAATMFHRRLILGLS